MRRQMDRDMKGGRERDTEPERVRVREQESEL